MAAARSRGQAVLDDGHVYLGTTIYGGQVAFRPAIVNWRTRPEVVEFPPIPRADHREDGNRWSAAWLENCCSGEVFRKPTTAKGSEA